MSTNTYDRLIELMRHRGTGKLMDRKNLAHNTKGYTLYNRSDTPTGVAVKLHSTEIIRAYSDGTIELTTGGWFTTTTKARMNDFLVGIHVYSDRGIWMVVKREWDSNLRRKRDRSQDRWARGDSENIYLLEFFNGMRFHEETGELVNPDDGRHGNSEPPSKRNLYSRATLERRITYWLDGLTPDILWFATNVPPTEDCTECILGSRDTDHLVDHLMKPEYSWGIIHAAIQDHGFQTGVEPVLRRWLKLAETNPKMPEMRKVLRGYFRRKLALHTPPALDPINY